MTERTDISAGASFDELAKELASGALSRRRALLALGAGIFGGALGSLGLSDDADAGNKRRRRKKKKNKNRPPNPAPPGAVVSCQNLGTACGLGGNTSICSCRLDKESQQTCVNFVNPPNGANFETCQTSANCPQGSVCEAFGGVCRSTCQTA